MRSREWHDRLDRPFSVGKVIFFGAWLELDRRKNTVMASSTESLIGAQLASITAKRPAIAIAAPQATFLSPASRAGPCR